MGQQVDDVLLDEDGNVSAGGDQHLFGGVWTRIKLEALKTSSTPSCKIIAAINGQRAHPFDPQVAPPSEMLTLLKSGSPRGQ